MSFTPVQLDFNSHLTGERRSTEITNDNSSNIDCKFAFDLIVSGAAVEDWSINVSDQIFLYIPCVNLR